MATEVLHIEQDTPESLWKVIGESVAILWKDWPKGMKVTVHNAHEVRFSLIGECPHCRNSAVFSMVGSPTFSLWANGQLAVSIMRCPGCQLWILALVSFLGDRADTFHYETHYPLGSPNETLDNSIPKEVAENFREAIRCQWVKAYRACVVMCGRAIETSVLALNAQGSNLLNKIDDLAAKGTITKPLKDFANEVRVARNIGAHADKVDDVSPEDAEDVMEFTREYLDHVYVMPAKLTARKQKPLIAKQSKP